VLGVLGVPPPNSLIESDLFHPQLKKGVGGCWGCWGVLGRLGNPSPRRPSLAIREAPARLATYWPQWDGTGTPSPGPPPTGHLHPLPPPADRGLRTGGQKQASRTPPTGLRGPPFTGHLHHTRCATLRHVRHVRHVMRLTCRIVTC